VIPPLPQAGDHRGSINYAKDNLKLLDTLCRESLEVSSPFIIIRVLYAHALHPITFGQFTHLAGT
jgi:hypothetical protein